MNIDYIRSIYQYNYALHRRVWDSVMQITEEQFLQEVDYSLGSLRNHLVHLMSVDQRWLLRVQGLALPDRLSAADFPTRAATRARWDEIEAKILRYINSELDEAHLQATLHYEAHGVPKANTVWQILVHVINHGTDHRAQMLPILNRMGAPTFDQDYIGYLWDQD